MMLAACKATCEATFAKICEVLVWVSFVQDLLVVLSMH